MISDIKDVESIKTLLDRFYSRAGKDALLKPIIAKLTASGFLNDNLYKYWRDAILGDETLEQTSPPQHIKLMSSPQHFMRWLTIFFRTINDLYSGPNAEKAKVLVIRKSEQFQASLQLVGF